MTCLICGLPYVLGGTDHSRCYEIQAKEADRCREIDEMLAWWKEWVQHDDPSEEADLLESAWGIIANAGGGNWQSQSHEWVVAAARWRDRYQKWIDDQNNRVSIPETKS
jgi:hypothetical protein